MVNKTRLAVGALASVLVATMTTGPAAAEGHRRSCPLPTFGPGAQYHPTIDRHGFTPNVDNPYFPLESGTTLVYTGVKDGKKAMDLFVPTSRTAVIDGVRTRVVEDRLYLDGVLEER